MSTDTSTRIKAVPSSVAVAAADVVKIDLAELIFGLTRKAIEGKIHRGDWLEGRQYHRAPDGIWIDVKGVQRWVTTGKP
jgi:hypothetical protein